MPEVVMRSVASMLSILHCWIAVGNTTITTL